MNIAFDGNWFDVRAAKDAMHCPIISKDQADKSRAVAAHPALAFCGCSQNDTPRIILCEIEHTV